MVHMKTLYHSTHCLNQQLPTTFPGLGFPTDLHLQHVTDQEPHAASALLGLGRRGSPCSYCRHRHGCLRLQDGQDDRGETPRVPGAFVLRRLVPVLVRRYDPCYSVSGY